MTLLPVMGHDEARGTLARSHLEETFPGALLLHGPPGVGKQRLGLWTGQLLLCSEPSEVGPCGLCRGCRQALRLEHPDLHWFFPLSRPEGSRTPEALEAALEAARAEAVSQVREAPLEPLEADPPRGLYLAAVRRIRSVALRSPTEGDRQLILISQAEELGAQGSSPEAANALLKVLEEPPQGTHLVLTSSRPGQVLETIRSRTVPLHLGPVAPSHVRAFLREHAEADEEGARKATRLAGGSIGRALRFLPTPDGALGPLETARRTAFRIVRAALQDGPERFSLPLEFPPSGAHGLGDILDAVDLWLRDLAATMEGGDDEALANPDAGPALRKLAEATGVSPSGCGQALLPVADTRRMAAGNVNPQLALAGLLADLVTALRTPNQGKASG